MTKQKNPGGGLIQTPVEPLSGAGDRHEVSQRARGAPGVERRDARGNLIRVTIRRNIT